MKIKVILCLAMVHLCSAQSFFEITWNTEYAPIRIKADGDSALFNQKIPELEKWTKRFTQFFKRNGPLDSLIYHGRAGDTLQLDTMTLNLLKFGLKARQITKGGIDVGIGNLLDAWGLNWGGKKQIPADSLRNRLVKELQVPPYRLIPQGIVLNRTGTHLSLGSFLEARILIEISNTLVKCRSKNYLVEVGGDFAFKGLNPEFKPWTLAIKDPTHPQRILAKIQLKNWSAGGFSTSGSYEQNFVDSLGHFHHHIFDPKTGLSTTGPLSVSVLSKNPLYNDLLDTWFMMTPFVQMKSFIQNSSEPVQVIVAYNNNTLWISPQIKSSIFDISSQWKVVAQHP